MPALAGKGIPSLCTGIISCLRFGSPVQPSAKARTALGWAASQQSVHTQGATGNCPCRSFLLLLSAVEKSSPSREGALSWSLCWNSGQLRFKPQHYHLLMLQVLERFINIKNIFPRGLAKNSTAFTWRERVYTQEGRLPHQLTSACPHCFQCSCNKGFEGAQSV